MRIGIKHRMTFGILGSTILIIVLILAVSFYYGSKEAIKEVENGVRNLARLYAQKFDGKFLKCEVIPQILTTHLETHPDISPLELKQLMAGILFQAPQIYGTCVAFEPHSFLPDKYYAPYYYHKGGKLRFVQLGDNYDYFDRDWYLTPKEMGKPFWTEPYYDTGGGETIMSTYSVPFYKKDHTFWGIATIDIAMDSLMNEIRALKVGSSGYAFIISREGRFVTFPDYSMVLDANLKDINAEICMKMTSGREGIDRITDPLSGSPSWIVYASIPSVGWSLAIIYPENEVMSGIDTMKRQIMLIGGAGLVLLLIIVLLLSRSITAPLFALVGSAKRAAQGDLDQTLPKGLFRDEIRELSNALQRMMSDLKNHIEVLKKTVAEKERIESEIKIAQEIQKSILPRTFPPFPDYREFDIAATTIPAREVGGDFYDFFFIDDDTLGFVIADVSDKGIPAALFMAVSRTLMRVTAMRGLSPGETLERVNALLIPDNDSAMFVTLFYGNLSISTGSVSYANGGHNVPYIKRSSGPIEKLDGKSGIVLGVWETARYPTHEISLQKGDLIYMYTDGVTEAENESLEMLSVSAVEEYLQELRQASPNEIIRGTLDRIAVFCGNATQTDDITILALQFFGGEDA